MTVERGLSAWRRTTNHNRMMDFKRGTVGQGPVEIAYFGGSAFRITSPGGLTVMLDPWRNLPTGKWDWYFHDFPLTEVDVGVSTHAHFDHDALDRLDASVLLDRLIGVYEFGDVRMEGVADKHAIDASDAAYDFHLINSYFGGQNLTPPDNARSWDNCLISVQTGGLRILHWGDNRPDPPEEVWERLGRVDILLMPVDDSQHVMGHGRVAQVIERLAPRVVIPHHYFIWNVVQRQSTLLPADGWIEAQPRVRRLTKPTAAYAPETLPDQTTIDHFGDHVAFDVEAWHSDHGLETGRGR
jgi:L-ascorbate metabolism protein UlaG (beta-lactamase superfamily)